jgi:MFS family permease
MPAARGTLSTVTDRPERLPAAFHRLWAADACSTAGDGFTLVAAPLLMTTLTTNPILIAGSAAAQQLPWLVFGLVSGAIVDRVDQRRLLMAVDSVRAVLIGILAVTVATGTATIPLVYVLLFGSGLGDTLVTTGATALVPRLVGRSALTRANSRLLATRLIGGSLLARPIGALLFTHGHGDPFAVDAVSFVVGVVLLAGLPRTVSTRPSRQSEPPAAEVAAPRRRIQVGDVREGLQVLWRDRVLRTLALSILVMNITLSGTLAILVIAARVRLGLTETGYGVLLASVAVGGLLGTVVVGPLLHRFGASLLLKVGLLIEAGTQLTLAVTTSAWVAGAALLVFGVHSAVWTVLTVSLRQHRIGDELRGRVSSAYMVLSVGGAALGALLGGVWVDVAGITAPMWFGAALVGVVFAVAVPTLRAADIELATSGSKSAGQTSPGE